MSSEAPVQDRGAQVTTGRMWASLTNVIIMITGVLGCLGILYFDIKYSYDGLVPVFNDWRMAFLFAFITTPAELMGAFIMSRSEQRKDVERWKYYFAIGIVYLAYVVDVGTNWMGMVDTMTNGDWMALSYVQWGTVAVVGTLMAFIEHALEFFIRTLAANWHTVREAAAWMQAKAEAAEQRGGHGSPGSSFVRPSMPSASVGRPGMSRPSPHMASPPGPQPSWRQPDQGGPE